MLWGAFNTWTNLLAFRATEDEEANWTAAIILTLFTSVVPFLIGLWMLIGATGIANANKAKGNQEQSAG